MLGMKEPELNFIKCCLKKHYLKKKSHLLLGVFVMIWDGICHLCACSFELPGAGSSCGKELLHCALHKRFSVCLVVESIFTGFWLRAFLSPDCLDLMQKLLSLLQSLGTSWYNYRSVLQFVVVRSHWPRGKAGCISHALHVVWTHKSSLWRVLVVWVSTGTRERGVA